MQTWNQLKIKDLGRVVTGKTPPTDNAEYFDGDELFVSPKDLSRDSYYVHSTETRISEKALDKFRGQVIPRDTVMFTSLSFAFGKMGIASKTCITNQQINSIVVGGNHHPRFVYYLLRVYEPFIFAYNSGIETPIVPKSVFEKIPVVVPHKSTQEKVAAVLSAYDDLIANNQRRIALLESMAEEIYREWFVRMRFPGADQTEFSKGIPCNWRHQRLNEVCSIVKGKSYAAEDLSDDDTAMPFVTLKSFNRGGGYRGAGLKFYKGDFKDDQIVRQGDIVMAVTDMTQDRLVVGQAARIPDLGERGAVISLDVMKLVPKTVDGTFLYLYLRFSGFSNYIKEFANGANVLHLKPDLVGKQSVALPAMDLQLALSKLAEPLLQEAEHLTQVSERLVAMRDALLPRLISGKLCVDQLDIQFPPSMRAETAEAAP